MLVEEDGKRYVGSQAAVSWVRLLKEQHPSHIRKLLLPSYLGVCDSVPTLAAPSGERIEEAEREGPDGKRDRYGTLPGGWATTHVP
jgi:hypothetical protein